MRLRHRRQRSKKHNLLSKSRRFLTGLMPTSARKGRDWLGRAEEIDPDWLGRKRETRPDWLGRKRR